MSKKWYNYFVSVDDPAATSQEQPQEIPEDTRPPAAKPPAGNAAQTIAEIAAAVNVAPKFTKPVQMSPSTSFDEIYSAAEISAPANGFTIFKVADMLKSQHIAALPPEVKRSSVLLALDAAGVKLQDILQDAVKRDRALDTFESVQQRALEQMEAQKAKENLGIEQEMDRVVKEFKARIQANTDQVAKERERFTAWRLLKQQEEQKIADAVAPFVSENPITSGVSGTAPTAAPEQKKV